MARFKIPKYMVFVENYPNSVISESGKVIKNKLREQAIETLGLQDLAAFRRKEKKTQVSNV
jgi:hypothetical protein